MGNYYQLNYSRNFRFYHHSEQASESALVETNSDEIEKRPGGLPKTLNKISEESLTAQMYRLYETLLPTDESAQKREEFARKIEKILNEEWPGHDIKVHMFGSSMNDLGTAESDVDLCVTTQWDGLKNIYVLSEFLKKHDMRIEQTVSKAKVPIVRLFDPNLDLACDINVNNTLALHNTRLIQKYVCIDPRVRPLAMIVKYWARRRVLNDAAKGGTISTYTWTCIILNFLQMRDPPILPVLHDQPGVKPIIVNGEDASFREDIENLKTFGESNKESLGGLLFAFFRYMAFEFDYDNKVISLRHGKHLTKAEKGWDTCKGWKMLCVEEPFNTARNLGNSADDISVNGLKQEFRRAYDILCESADLESLCEEYRVQYNHYNNYYNNHYNHNKNYNYNRGYHHNYKSNKRNLRTSNTGHVKSGNRNPCMKPHNGQQNEQTTDNFYDMNGRSNYPQDNEEDRSNMPRFHVDNVLQNSYYSTINGSGIASISDVDHVKRDHDTFSMRNDYQKRERNGFVSSTMRHAEVNDSQIQHHNVSSLNLREDEQLLHSHPQTKSVKNNVHRQSYTKKKNDERPSYSDQSNNYVRQSQDSDHSAYKPSQDTNSNQNQTFYKNNNQKSDNNWNRSRLPYSDQKSSSSQSANASYGSDNKYNNYSRRQNTSSDLDQRTSVSCNYRQKSNKQDYNNSRQVEDPNSSSIISSRLKPSSSIVDDSSNFNPVQMPSPKPIHKSNNHHKNNGKQHTYFNSKSPQQFQKPAENFDFANNAYQPYPMLTHIVPVLTDQIYTNHGNGFLSQNTIPAFTPTFQNHHGQLNDGTTNYPRRNSHQSSSDGSNSQTSGNTSNTSYSNSSSNYTKHSNQKNNGNNSNQNQNNYHQQPRQSKPNNNNFNRKRRNNNNNNNNNHNHNYNYTNGNNGFINSGNGNYRPNSTASNPSPAVNLNVNDSTFNYHEDSIISNLNISPQMNQGYHSMSKVGNDYNGDANGKFYNNGLKNYNNSNNSNSWKNPNTRIINSSNNNTNGSKSTNGGNNSSNRNVNSSNSNNNYSRSNGNNYNNNNSNSNNLHKSVNGNNQNVYKAVDVNNNYNAQTKNVNNNHSNSIKNGGNNNSGNTNVQRNNSERYYCNKSNRNNKNMRRNSNTNFKAEKKEDCFNYQQQYSQEIQLPSSRQNNYNIQSHQQNNSHQQESSSKPKNVQKKKVGQKRNMHKEFQQQQYQQQQRFQQQQ